MKNTSKLYKLGGVLLTLFAATALIFTGCKRDDDDEDQTTSRYGVDFTNYSASGSFSIKVKNNTAKALVAFKGNPSKANLIGGIPASATNHALPKNSTLFSTSSDFILFIVTEEDYKKYYDGGDFSVLANSPFARFYAYYNTNADNETVYEISSKMGGSAELKLQNNTKYNVELRINSTSGETLGYTAAQTLNTTFHVTPGDYSIFPVFRKYNSKTNEIITVYPKDAEGNAYIEFFNLQDSYELNALSWSSNVTFTAASAYIWVNNQSTVGIQFYKGTNPVTTSTGGKIINATDHLVFEIPMPQAGNVVAQSTDISAYAIGTPASTPVSITGGETKTIEAGKMYTLTVTGTSYAHLNCKFSENVQDVTDEDFENVAVSN